MAADQTPWVVALSGGVDSATVAALLVDEGRPVIGMTMRLYDAGGTTASSGGRCCGPRDIEDARRVCEHLGIPFYVVDFAEYFSERVVDDFVDSYLRGETPNPCVRCNQHIKFTPLLKRARALGAEVVATGHYARLEPAADGRRRLRRGADPGKDQSYFLFSMPGDELESLRFPLGALTKDEVRERARRFKLPNADKRDSQEICFVPDGDYAGFVEAAATRRGLTLPVAGDIVTEDGRAVGRHKGIHRYTVGQRRGLGAVGGGEALYVVRIDKAANRVVVGARGAAGGSSLPVRDLRWLVEPPGEGFACAVQVRHRAKPVPARLRWQGAELAVELETPLAAAPGQAAVFYEGDTVLGGGWIAAPTSEGGSGSGVLDAARVEGAEPLA